MSTWQPVSSVMPRIVLPARSDHVANPVAGDHHHVQARGVVRHFLARLADFGGHVVEDVQPADLGLGQGLPHDVAGHAGDLDVHLQGGDAAAGSGDLEVHVAVVVLLASDVAEDGEVLVVLDQAHRDARDRGQHRNARVEQRQGAGTDGGHRRGSVRFEDLRDDAHRVGEVVLGRQHGNQSPAGQNAVSDLAPAGAAQETHLTDGEGREVVVEEELLMGLPLVLLDDLRIAAGTERDRGKGLGLAAGEERRTVDAGQESRFAVERPDLVEGAVVEALVLLHHDLAQRLVLELADDLADLGALLVVLGQLLEEAVHHGLDGVAALELRGRVERRGEVVPDRAFDLLLELRRVGLGRLPVGLLEVHLAEEVLLCANDLLQFLVTREDAVEDHALVELVGAGLDHRHRVLGADNDQVEVGDVALGAGRIEHDLVVDQSDADGAPPGGRTGCRRARAQSMLRDREDVGIVLLVGREDETDDLGFVEVPRREERPQRPIGQAAGDDLLLGGASLALEEAARDATRRRGVLAVVDGEGAESLAGCCPAPCRRWSARLSRRVVRCRNRWPAWRCALIPGSWWSSRSGCPW